MPYKLSLIKEQTIGQTGWNTFANNPYDEGKIADITDNMGKMEVPVTSIPSPFAQMHLFETSFAFINKSYVNAGKDAAVLSGKTTYHKYISYCLDVFEILFSFETLKLADRIAVDIWHKEELDQLVKSHSEGSKTFAETLKIFIGNYNNDTRFKNNQIQGAFDEFALIYLDNTIIAGTSPYTGFFTVGDELPTTLKSGYKNRYFFDENMPLYQRSAEFQTFMNAFFTGNAQLTQSFKEVYNYMKINREHIEDFDLRQAISSMERNFNDEHLKAYTNLEINREEVSLLGGTVTFLCDPFDWVEERDAVRESDYVIQTRKTLINPPLALLQGLNKKRWNYYGSNTFSPEIMLHETTPIKKRKLPGTAIEYPWITRNDVLAKHLIQLDYRVNDSKFWLPEGEVKNIILPIQPQYFDYFTIEDLKRQLTITQLKLGAIVVGLDIPVKAGTISFERTYDMVSPETVDNDDYGAVVKSSMAFGIYPFFKVSDSKYNDRYKILSYHMKGEELSYNFFRQDVSKPTCLHLKASEHSRTRKDENYPSVSNYLELTTIKKNDQGETTWDTELDITFDAVGVTLNAIDKGVMTKGILIPLMGEPTRLMEGDTSIAFDIGTSNSFVAIKTGNTSEHLSTYQGKKNSAKPDLVMLNHPSIKDHLPNFDLDGISAIYGRTQIAEFLPSLLGGNAFFKFPIRSIINIDNDTNPEKADEINILSNTNIPFGFGQYILRKDYDFAHSNIKWGVTDGSNLEAQNKLRGFIEQLVWLGRNKLLSEGYNPSATNVLWFRPLSMNMQQRTTFSSIWDELFSTYFGKSDNTKRLHNITESWAPFYCYEKHFGSGEVYMNIDIGGGTSDIITFVNNQPALTTSFRFAGNSLFESRSTNNPFDNGFIVKYEAKMRAEFGSDFKKTDIIDYIKDAKGLLSTDLISYFFTYSSFNKKLMLDGEFKLLFLLHNSALFYHAFQMLKMSAIDKLPSYVGISGNGAKLLTITNGLKDLNRPNGISMLVGFIIKHIFAKEQKHKIELQILDNPKEATAIGGIEGLKSIQSNTTADEDNYYLSIGDATNLCLENKTKKEQKYQYANYLKSGDTTITSVTQNVIGFFDYFFDDLWYDADFIKNFGLEKSFNPKKLKAYFSDPDKIGNTIREVINHKIEVEQETTLNDSLFFEAIKSYLYAFSRILVSDKVNQFKGA